MDLFGILFLVFLVVLFFAFIFCLVKSAKKLGWIHSILVVFLFVETVVFMMATAGVLYRRVGWIRLHDSLVKKVEAAEKETIELTYGDLRNPVLDITKLYPLQNALGRLVLDRGRVWSSAVLIGTQNNSVQLNLNAAVPAAVAPADGGMADPNAPAAAPAPPAGDSLKPDSVVFAFSEKADELGRYIPAAYLGEFTVTDNQAGVVTLTPLLLSPQYATLVNDSNQWSLYELMPLDSHDAFVEVGSAPSEDELFGRVDAEKIKAQYASLPEAEQALVVDSYIRDGQAANENDPPEVVWELVEFLKEYQFDVDSQQESTALDGGYFDDSGRSIDGRLKRPGENNTMVKFAAGDQLLLFSANAVDLITNGTAKVIKRYYVRQLNDYDDSFRIIDRQKFEVGERIAYFQRESKVLEDALAISNLQRQARQIEIENLKKERDQYSKELEVMNSEVTRLTDSLQQTRTKLSELFRTNQGLYQQIVAENQRLKKVAGPGLASLEEEAAK
jgi:hypothetical protein